LPNLSAKSGKSAIFPRKQVPEGSAPNFANYADFADRFSECEIDA
jgi:hypothetical protein